VRLAMVIGFNPVQVLGHIVRAHGATRESIVLSKKHGGGRKNLAENLAVVATLKWLDIVFAYGFMLFDPRLRICEGITPPEFPRGMGSI